MKSTGVAAALARGAAELEVGPTRFLPLCQVPRLRVGVLLAAGVTRKTFLVRDDKSASPGYVWHLFSKVFFT